MSVCENLAALSSEVCRPVHKRLRCSTDDTDTIPEEVSVYTGSGVTHHGTCYAPQLYCVITATPKVIIMPTKITSATMATVLPRGHVLVPLHPSLVSTPRPTAPPHTPTRLSSVLNQHLPAPKPEATTLENEIPEGNPQQEVPQKKIPQNEITQKKIVQEEIAEEIQQKEIPQKEVTQKEIPKGEITKKEIPQKQRGDVHSKHFHVSSVIKRWIDDQC